MHFQQIILLRKRVSTVLGHLQAFIIIKVETIKLHSVCSITQFSILHTVWYTLLIIVLQLVLVKVLYI